MVKNIRYLNLKTEAIRNKKEIRPDLFNDAFSIKKDRFQCKEGFCKHGNGLVP
jgi:hypothetical protein